LAVAVAAVAMFALGAPVLAQWPTTCLDLNDIVETHLGNDSNVAIYQRVFGDEAEPACRNDHRDDVRAVFGWAFDMSAQSPQTETPDVDWPTTCVELNDIVEAHLGNDNNVRIYQRVFGNQAEPACRSDHREDVRGVFAWAFAGLGSNVATPDAPRWATLDAGSDHTCGVRTDGHRRLLGPESAGPNDSTNGNVPNRRHWRLPLLRLAH